MFVRITNRQDPNQAASSEGLSCMATLFDRQLVFENLEHLPYANNLTNYENFQFRKSHIS